MNFLNLPEFEAWLVPRVLDYLDEAHVVRAEQWMRSVLMNFIKRAEPDYDADPEASRVSFVPLNLNLRMVITPREFRMLSQAASQNRAWYVVELDKLPEWARSVMQVGGEVFFIPCNHPRSPVGAALGMNGARINPGPGRQGNEEFSDSIVHLMEALVGECGDKPDWLRISVSDAEALSKKWVERLAREASEREGAVELIDDFFVRVEVAEGEEAKAERIQVFRLLDAQALSREGKLMRHCVGSYAGKVQRGGTAILSFRDADGKSLATMELEGSAIRQVKAFANAEPTGYIQVAVNLFRNKNKLTYPDIMAHRRMGGEPPNDQFIGRRTAAMWGNDVNMAARRESSLFQRALADSPAQIDHTMRRVHLRATQLPESLVLDEVTLGLEYPGSYQVTLRGRLDEAGVRHLQNLLQTTQQNGG